MTSIPSPRAQEACVKHANCSDMECGGRALLASTAGQQLDLTQAFSLGLAELAIAFHSIMCVVAVSSHTSQGAATAAVAGRTAFARVPGCPAGWPAGMWLGFCTCARSAPAPSLGSWLAVWVLGGLLGVAPAKPQCSLLQSSLPRTLLMPAQQHCLLLLTACW